MTLSDIAWDGSIASEKPADEDKPPVKGYVETRGPPVPDIAYKVINPLTAALFRSPLHTLVSDSLMLITFTGRKSGDEYTTPGGY